jgi:putative nucleotidyltransferase with HDIG domain
VAQAKGNRAGAKAKQAPGTGNANGGPNGKNGSVATRDPRAVATEIGRAVLVATSLETARHSDDVVLIAREMCAHLSLHGSDSEDVLAAARLHDIGKASVPRQILEKAGPLSATEWDLMREHTIVGEQILGSVAELEGIARLVRHSHERWDGDGYPDGLLGEEIPLGSRIIFCADAFHAIRCDRPYRSGRSADRALAEVVRCSGTQFDPRVVAALEDVVRELRPTTPRRPRRG